MNSYRQNGYTNQGIGRKELFDKIGAVSFAMDDLRLYLDTHPNCAEALSLFTEYMNVRQELVSRYTQEFGPIDSYYVDTDDGWSWISEPMPWKAEAN